MKKIQQKPEENKKRIRLREYPYTYARVSVMKSKLIRRETYTKLLKMGVNEIARFLQETEYKKEIDELASKRIGADLIEDALNANMARTILKLKRISEDEGLRSIIDAYIIRNDIWNIKTIFRGKHTMQREEDIRELMMPTGKLSEGFLSELIRKESVEDVVRSLGFMELKNLSNALHAYKERKSLFDLENALDHDYYSYLMEFSKRLPKEGKLFREFVENEIDILNIKMLLRLKKEKIEKKAIEKYLIYPGARLTRRELGRLSAAEDTKSMLRVLQMAGYKGMARELEKKEGLLEIELKLNKYLLDRAILLLHQHPLSVDVILGYMFAKEIEIKNLKTIVKGKQLGIDEGFIESQLVVGS